MTSLILIIGPTDSGKTTIAWKVLERLWSEATAVRFWDKDNIEITNPKDIQDVRNRANGDNDFHAMVTVRNQTFAITSGGDYQYTVANGLQWGWRTRVNGIIQCINSSHAPMKVLSWYRNMPRKIYQTHHYASGDPRVAQQENRISAEIVKCVMEP